MKRKHLEGEAHRRERLGGMLEYGHRLQRLPITRRRQLDGQYCQLRGRARQKDD